MAISLDQQVIQLPSQATRKRRKPSKRRTTKTNAVASPVDYSPAMSRNLGKINSAYTRQFNADRRAAAQQRAAELKGQPIF